MKFNKSRKPSTSLTLKELESCIQKVTFSINAELKAALNSLGGESKSQPIFHMINDIVEEGTDSLDFEQFLDLMTARVSNKDSREDMKKVFMLFDEEKSGFISLASLKKVVKELGENIDEAELQEMIQKADADRDGLINEEEFYNVMTRKATK
jgi:centrin-1